MSAERSMAEFSLQEADALFGDRPVNGVLLDASGVIVYANERWKAFAREQGLTIPNDGIGETYLRYCAFADSQVVRVVEGITQLLAGKVDCFSLIYPCHAPDRRRWFLLLGFPYLKGASRVALLHIDISMYFPAAAETWAPTILKEEAGTEAFSPQIERMLRAVERSLLSALAPTRQHADSDPAPALEGKSGTPLPPLSKRQRSPASWRSHPIRSRSMSPGSWRGSGCRAARKRSTGR